MAPSDNHDTVRSFRVIRRGRSPDLGLAIGDQALDGPQMGRGRGHNSSMACWYPRTESGEPRLRKTAAFECSRSGIPSLSCDKRVKLFKNGRNQAVRIPREFQLPGEYAVMRKEGMRLVIGPAPPKSLLAVLRTLSRLREEFADTPPAPVDL